MCPSSPRIVKHFTNHIYRDYSLTTERQPLLGCGVAAVSQHIATLHKRQVVKANTISRRNCREDRMKLSKFGQDSELNT